MENRIPPRFSLLYLRKKQTDNLINMQNLTTQCHSKKVLRTVKYCVSKESVQQTKNLSAIAKDCKNNLQNEVMTHLRLKPKLIRLNFQIRKIC